MFLEFKARPDYHKAVSIAKCKLDEATKSASSLPTVMYAVYFEPAGIIIIGSEKRLKLTGELKKICQDYGRELLEETADSGYWGSGNHAVAIGLCALR